MSAMSKRQNNLIEVWSKARGKRRNTSEGVESLVDLTSDEPRHVYKGDERGDEPTGHEPEEESQNSLPESVEASLEEGRQKSSL